MANDPISSLFGLTSRSHMVKPTNAADGIAVAQASEPTSAPQRLSALETAFFTKAQMDSLKLSPLAEALSGSEAASQLFEQLDPRARNHLAELISTRLLTVEDVVKGLRGMAKEAVMTGSTILIGEDQAGILTSNPDISRLANGLSVRSIGGEGTGSENGEEAAPFAIDPLLAKERTRDTYWEVRAEGIKSLNEMNLFSGEEDAELTSASDIKAVEKLKRYLKHPPDMERYFQQAQVAYLKQVDDWSEDPPDGYVAVTFDPAARSATQLTGYSTIFESGYPNPLGSAATFLKEIQATTIAIQKRNAQDAAYHARQGDKVSDKN